MANQLAGHRFGKLVALEPSEKKNGHYYWSCSCDCGGTRVVAGTHLKSGRVVSCGCESKNRGKLLDLAGRKFGSLTVVSRRPNKTGSPRHAVWLCRCDCGRDIEVSSRALVQNGQASCGCMTVLGTRAEDLTGQKFNMLTVVSSLGFHPDSNNSIWKCECDCGAEVTARGTSLKTGRQKSCATCKAKRTEWSRNIRMGKQEVSATAKNRYGAARNNARKMGLAFDVSFERYEEISNMPCVGCGFSGGQVCVDRKDSLVGYVDDGEQLQPLCQLCNRMKSAMDHDKFIAHCRAVASRHPLPSTSNVVAGPWADRNENASPLRWAVQ